MIARRRPRRQPVGSAGGMTQEDRDAIRSYRANRGSKSYYRDLRAIDDKSPAQPAPADKDKK